MIHIYDYIFFHYGPWCFPFGLLRTEAKNTMHDS